MTEQQQPKEWMIATHHWTNAMWTRWENASMDANEKVINRLMCHAVLAWPYDRDPSLSASWQWLYDNDGEAWFDATIAIDYLRGSKKPFLFKSADIEDTKYRQNIIAFPPDMALPTCNDPKPAPRKPKAKKPSQPVQVSLEEYLAMKEAEE